MATNRPTQARVRSRDHALGLLQRLTVGVALGALAGVGHGFAARLVDRQGHVCRVGAWPS